MSRDARDKVETWFKENERLSQDEQRSLHSRSRDSHSVRSSRRGSEHEHEHQHQHHDNASSIRSGHSGQSSHRRRRKRRSSDDGESRSSQSTQKVSPAGQFPVDIKLVAGWLEVIGNLEAAQAAYAHYSEYRRKRRSKRQKKKSLPSIKEAIRMLKPGMPSSLRKVAMISSSQLSQSWVSEVDLANRSTCSFNDDSSSRRRRHHRSSRGDESDAGSIMTAADAKRTSRSRDNYYLEPKAHRSTKYASHHDYAASHASLEHDLTSHWSRVVDELKESNHNPNSDPTSTRRGSKCPGCRTCSCSSGPDVLPTVPEDGSRPVQLQDPIQRVWSPLIPQTPREGRQPGALTLPQTIRLAALLKQKDSEKWAKVAQAVMEKEKQNGQLSTVASVHGSAWVRERRVKRLLKVTRPTFANVYKRDDRAKYWGA